MFVLKTRAEELIIAFALIPGVIPAGAALCVILFHLLAS